MKQYTTPTVRITIPQREDLLSVADTIIVTASDGTTDIDLEPTIDGDTVTVTLTEQQTTQLEVGPILFEVTIKWGEQVFKTKTVKTRMEEAVREEVLVNGGTS